MLSWFSDILGKVLPSCPSWLPPDTLHIKMWMSYRPPGSSPITQCLLSSGKTRIWTLAVRFRSKAKTMPEGKYFLIHVHYIKGTQVYHSQHILYTTFEVLKPHCLYIIVGVYPGITEQGIMLGQFLMVVENISLLRVIISPCVEM